MAELAGAAEGTVSQRSWIILVVVAAAVCVAAVLLVWRPWDTAPAIETKALGVWQEQTAAEPIRLTVSSAGSDDPTTQYWITLPTSSKTPLPAHLEGDAIAVWGENIQDVLWRITYGEGADVLLLTRPSGMERHILRRVSR